MVALCMTRGKNNRILYYDLDDFINGESNYLARWKPNTTTDIYKAAKLNDLSKIGWMTTVSNSDNWKDKLLITVVSYDKWSGIK